MAKIDPFKNEERYLSWEKKCEHGIPGLSEKNSNVIKQYLEDMKYGINISSTNKKGARSYTRLNSLKNRMIFLARKFEEIFELNDVTKLKEEQLLTFFNQMRNGIFLMMKKVIQ